MYLMHIPLYLALILAKIGSVPEDVIGGMVLAGFVLLFMTIPLCGASLVVALTNLAVDVSNPVKTAMIVKLCLVPWYIVNFLICATLVVGLLNPWLVLTVPVIVLIEVGVTYILMLSTSLHSVAYTVRKHISNKTKPDAFTLVSMILQAFFCLDVIGAIMLYIKDKKSQKQN